MTILFSMLTLQNHYIQAPIKLQVHCTYFSPKNGSPRKLHRRTSSSHLCIFPYIKIKYKIITQRKDGLVKRILFLVPRMNIGGAETYVYTAAKELRARGYEVFLASGGGRLADELKTAGIRTFFVPIRQSRFLSVWRVSSIVKKYHIDIIHANSGAAGIIAAGVKRNTSVPVVYTAHGILGNMEKEYVIDQLDQIICVSEYVRQDSIARGLHENHLLVRYSGIDTERFTANEEVFYGTLGINFGIDTERFTANEEERIRLRKEFGFDEDTLVLAIVSRIKNLEHKGHGHLLSMLDKYGRKENWKLLVIGKGKGLPLLKTKIRAMHLSDKVLCLGHRTDVEHLLNAADLTVLPSRFETFGLVLAEGMAMGKPAIAFSIGGTPEIVKDGETGFLVEKDNEKELYECIKQLDSDRSLLKQFSENGIRWVRSRFTNRRMVDDLEVIYHKLSP